MSKNTKYSPYLFRYENGIYSQSNKESGVTISEISVTERDRLLEFIIKLDEELWALRKHRITEVNTLYKKINGIEKIINGS